MLQLGDQQPVAKPDAVEDVEVGACDCNDDSSSFNSELSRSCGSGSETQDFVFEELEQTTDDSDGCQASMDVESGSSTGGESAIGYELVSPINMIHPVAVLGWIWVGFFRIASLYLGGPASRTVEHTVCALAANLPCWIVMVWYVAGACNLPVYPMLLLLGFYVGLVFVDDTVGTTTGLVVAPLTMMLIFWIMYMRRGRAFLILGFAICNISVAGGLAMFVYEQGCMASEVPRSFFVLFRAMVLPLYETALRKGYAWLWVNYRGETPRMVFVLAISLSVIFVECIQMTNLLSVAYSEHPRSTALVLALCSIVSDVVSRSKVLQVGVKALRGHRFHLDQAADVALRARWAYVYTLIPFVALMAAFIVKHELVWRLLILVLVTELLSDVAFLLVQHALARLQGSTDGLFGTLRTLLCPGGQKFPELVNGCDKELPMKPAIEVENEESMPAVLCISPETMAGAYLVVIPAEVTYLAFAGLFYHPHCLA